MSVNGECTTDYYNGKKAVKFSWSRKSVVNNASDCYSVISFSLDGVGQSGYHYAGPIKVYVNKTSGTPNFTFWSDRAKLEPGTNIAKDQEFIIHHDKSTGTASFYVYIEAAIYTYAVNCYARGDWTLDTIPRNFSSTPSISGNSKTINTYTLNWSTSETCSKVVLYVNGNWNGEWTGSAKSGTIKATGLNPATTYNMYVNCTRKDSGQTSNSSTKQYTTYQKGLVTSAPDFNDEENPSIGYKNEAGNTVDTLAACISLTGAKDDVPYRDISKTGTSYTFNLTNDERTTLRKACSNTPNDLTVKFYVRTVSGGKTYYSIVDKKMTIKDGQPIFTDFNIEDIDEKILSLTNNAQKYIRKYSDIKITIPSGKKMVAQKESTAQSYNIIIGEQSKTISYSTDDLTTIINNMDGNKVEIYAIDSRGKQTPVSKSLEIIDYKEIALSNIEFNRKNSVEENVLITGNGIWTNVDFGQVENSIKNFVFRRKSKNETVWSEWYSILNLFHINEDGTFNNKIENEFTALTFHFGEEYDIEIKIEDELSVATRNISVNSGKILMSALKEYGVNFGGIYDKEEGGVLQVNGKNIESLSTGITGDTLPIGSVVDFDGTEIPENWVEVDDTEWKTANLSSTFTSYSNKSENLPKYKKIGKTVEIRGVIAPNSDLASNTEYTIFTLPQGYRPSHDINKLCQGTTTRIWLLSVYTTGTVSLSRYREGASWMPPYQSNWFPFQLRFFVD